MNTKIDGLIGQRSIALFEFILPHPKTCLPPRYQRIVIKQQFSFAVHACMHTVDREIFAELYFRVINFSAFNFRHLASIYV